MSNRALRLVPAAILLAGAAHAQKAELRIDTGTAPGSMDSQGAVMAASGASVYVAWFERPHNETNGNIYFNRSLDGGATWFSVPLRLDRGGRLEGSVSPAIAAAGSAVYAVWSDARSGSSDLYFDRSLDGGTTWLPAELRIDDGPPGATYSGDPQIAVDGTTVHVVWLESPTTGPRDVHYQRSLDGGLSWLEQSVRLDSDPVAGRFDSSAPVLVLEGGAVHVAWEDARNGDHDVYFNRSLDGGEHWLPEDVRLDVGTVPGASWSHSPTIAATPDSVVVAWTDRRSSRSSIYFNRSSDGGSSWLASDRRLGVSHPPEAGSSFGCRLAASGDTVYAAWYYGAAASFEHQIYFSRSLDGGRWWGRDRRIDGGDDNATGPGLCAEGDAVYVAWRDSRAGVGRGIYFDRSLDRGATWLPRDDARLTVVDPAVSDQSIPELVASGGCVYVLWSGSRSGWDDVYFNLALGQQPYGEGLAGSDGIVPVLGASGDAAIGGTYEVAITRALGGAPGWLVLGFSGPASIPLPAGTLLVEPPLFRKAFVLGGSKQDPGSGSAAIPFAIPLQRALVGLRVDFQAFVVDPRAQGGFSMSAGLDAWIL